MSSIPLFSSPPALQIVLRGYCTVWKHAIHLKKGWLIAVQDWPDFKMG